MKKYKRLYRINEQAAPPQEIQQLPVDIEKSLKKGEEEDDLEVNVDFQLDDEETLSLPGEGESTVDHDTMSMTVRDFVQKCKEVDPLICLGIEAFIENNKEAFGEPVQTDVEIEGDDSDLSAIDFDDSNLKAEVDFDSFDFNDSEEDGSIELNMS